MLSVMCFLIMAGVEMVNYSGKFAFEEGKPASQGQFQPPHMVRSFLNSVHLIDRRSCFLRPILERAPMTSNLVQVL